jgi:hypothetical protein
MVCRRLDQCPPLGVLPDLPGYGYTSGIRPTEASRARSYVPFTSIRDN